MSKQYTAMDIANYFIHYNNYRRMENGDDLISNNKNAKTIILCTRSYVGTKE